MVLVLLCACSDGEAPKDSGELDTQAESPTDTFSESESPADSDSASDSDSGGEVSRDPIEVALGNTAIVKLIGEEQEGTVGSEVFASGAGDLDGDSRADVVVGMRNLEAGRVYVLHAVTLATGSLAGAPTILSGTEPSCIGHGVSSAGDIDGDGTGDVMFGDVCFEDGDTGPGRTLVVSGSLVGTHSIDDVASATLLGEWEFSDYSPQSATGASNAAVGDTNGDGFDDILIGAPYYDSWGAAYLVSGPISGDVDLATGSTLRVVDTGLGEVDGAGDTNGDGLADILLGDGGGTSCVRMFLGPASGVVVADDADTLVACDDDPGAGQSPAGAGDVDGDGYADVLVDAVGTDVGDENVGAVHLFRGPLAEAETLAASDAVMTGDEPADAGRDVDGAGDVNGDGRSDILIGAPNAGHEDGTPNYAGTAWLVLGPVSGTLTLDNADVTFLGEGGDDEAGTVVAGAGDIDGDGLDDILIAGPGDDDGGEDAGAVWVDYAASLW